MYFKLFILINFIFNVSAIYGPLLGVVVASRTRVRSRETVCGRQVDNALQGRGPRDRYIKQQKFMKIDMCNCTISQWYINQCGKLKRYLLENKEVLYILPCS